MKFWVFAFFISLIATVLLQGCDGWAKKNKNDGTRKEVPSLRRNYNGHRSGSSRSSSSSASASILASGTADDDDPSTPPDGYKMFSATWNLSGAELTADDLKKYFAKPNNPDAMLSVEELGHVLVLCFQEVKDVAEVEKTLIDFLNSVVTEQSQGYTKVESIFLKKKIGMLVFKRHGDVEDNIEVQPLTSVEADKSAVAMKLSLAYKHTKKVG